MRLRLTGMTAGLTIGISAAVVAAFGVGAYFYSAHHVAELVERDRTIALAQGELMRAALEHQMLENDRTLIAELVRSFAREPRVRKVMLLDRSGAVRYSSDAVEQIEALPIESATCQSCHRLPPAERSNSRVIETSDGTVLRTVIPFRNREACHRCHDPVFPINGVMFVDMDASETRTAMSADLRWMVLGSSILAFALIAVLAVIVRVLVLRRLQRFETTARLIAAGDLKRRVPVGGADTISWLATEFNAMADATTSLVDQVRQQRERLEVVINSIDDGIVVLDKERRVLAANEAFLSRAETQREQVVGRDCRQVMSGGACSGNDCPALVCLATNERHVRLCERHTQDGRIAFEEIHASPIRDGSGALAQVVEVWRDISERRAAEARLAESHRMASLGMLASGFSHELNTPLGTVLTCVEGILRDVHANDDASSAGAYVAQSAAMARDQVLRCRSITQQFLRLSRGEETPLELIDIGLLVPSVLRLVEPSIAERGVSVALTVPDPVLRARANEAELQQALINLLLNAAQACQPGGHITVAVTAAERLRIRIADDGCGIPAADQPRIFEPFFSRRAGGTGLGLFVTREIVRRAGGDISVSSTPGAGATFEIALPLVASGPASPVGPLAR